MDPENCHTCSMHPLPTRYRMLYFLYFIFLWKLLSFFVLFGMLGSEEIQTIRPFFYLYFYIGQQLGRDVCQISGSTPETWLERFGSYTVRLPKFGVAYWVHSYTEYVKVKLLAYEFDFILVLGGQFFDIFCSKLVYCLQSCLGVQERHRFVLKTKWTDFGVNYYSTAHLIRKRPIKKSCWGLAKHKKVRESSPWN